MSKEKINMELKARIFIVISVSSLILYICVEGLNVLPFIAKPNSKLDYANQHPPVLGQPKVTPSPVSPTALDDEKQALPPYPESEISSIPSSASTLVSDLDLAPGPGSSELFVPDPGPEYLDLGPGVAPGPGSSGFFDEDIVLAIEARIKQSQADSQAAMDEAKKLLEDPEISSSETGKCLDKCVEKYGASLGELKRAIMDLGVRDVRLLADDFGAVENDISACQACFTENIGEDSPLKALEEATTKAARECLTVMDYAL